MAEIAQLSELIDRVRIEASLALGATFGIAQRLHIIGLLNRIQRDLARDRDWDELHTHVVIPTVIGTFTYSIPNTMNYEGMEKLTSRDGTSLKKMKLGFGPQEFAKIDPATTNSWPIERWRLSPLSVSDFEVWPNPDKVASIDIEGQKKPALLVDDADSCTLDADVLVLRVAGHLLAKSSPREADLKFANSDRAILSLLARQGATKDENITLGGGLRRQHVDQGLD